MSEMPRWLAETPVDFAAIDSAPRDALRARLDITEEQTAIVVLPPLTRAAGAEYAVWATLLLEKVRPEVRLIVPGPAEENRRIRYLVRSCRHQYMMRLAEELSLAELVAAADIATFLPIAAVPLTGLAWAMAAGRTIVASAVPPVAALLEAGRTAWLCRPRDPQDGARYMLKALDEPVVSARLAAAAREKALALFSAPRMVKPTNCNGV